MSAKGFGNSQKQDIKNVYGSQVAQAIGNVVQTQNNCSDDMDREQVKRIVDNISKKVSRLDCTDEVKRKCASYLEIVSDETRSADPDKDLVAKTLMKTIKNLKNDPGAISSDTDHLKELCSTVQLIHPWLGEAKKFLVL